MSEQLPRYMAEGRTAAFAKDERLERVLALINRDLPQAARPPDRAPRLPVIFVVGAPRSGTTLMMQWLASLGYFAYPSNLIARFFSNPYFGALVQQALGDFDTTGQIGLMKELDFSSTLGRTKGPYGPSDFFYFWRQFYAFGDTQAMAGDILEAVDTAPVKEGLAGLEAAYDKPVAMKGMLHNWHLPHLDTLAENVLFIHMDREPVANALSLLAGRRTFFGDEDVWYSFKPPEYEALLQGDKYHQVAGQVFHTKRAIGEGLARIDAGRQLTVSYEDFCADTAPTYRALREKLAAMGFEIPAQYKDQTNLAQRVSTRRQDSAYEAAEQAYKAFKA